MNAFKKKSLYATLAGLGALTAAGAAQAVNVNADGLGQVLIYPYYTVRSIGPTPGSPYNSLLSVVNSTASAKAVKVRFIEGKNSREVLDFNLFLSHHDVWTAVVIPAPVVSGTPASNIGAAVFTTDNSCTVPHVGNASSPQAFVNNAYLGDGAGDTLDRTTEGYVEIIEMGTILGGSSTEAGVTHNSGGVPTCGNLGDATVTANIRNPSGGLFGGISLVNVLAGVDVTENAVALDNFRQTGKYDLPGDIKPDLRDVQPPVAVLFDGNVVRSATGFTQSVDAVSALFMMNNIYNEFVLDTVTRSGTDWVLTMPTKRYYYDADGTVNYLFQRNFVTNACDDIALTVWDREEQTPTTPAGFSPPPPPGKAVGLCWEANVLSFQFGSGTSNILGSANSLTRTGMPSQNGWARVTIGPVTSFDGAFAHRLPASTIITTQLAGGSSTSAGNFIGLPIIGFAAQSFTNGTLTNNSGSLIQANYAGAFVHRGTRSVVLTTTP
jgi:hypothetical protein